MGRGHAAKSLVMSDGEYKVLNKYNQSRTIPHHYKVRSSIILRASRGESNLHISREEKTTRLTVLRWRSRWAQGYERLQAYQSNNPKAMSDYELLEKILELLSDEPRAGAPEQITLAEKQQIVALACEKPEDHGIPMTQWNREMLAKVAVAEGIVAKISPRYISDILKKMS
jgi:putative transposase